MPICPECDAVVEVGEGDVPVACPRCGASIRGAGGEGIAAGMPPGASGRANFDGDYADVRLRVNKWRTALIGMHLLFWSVLVIAAFQAISLTYQTVSPMVPDDANPFQPAFFVIMAVGAFVMVGYVGYLVGLVMSCLAPDPKARGWAITCVVSLAVAVAFAVALFGVVIYRMIPEMQAQIAAQQAAQQGAAPPPAPRQDPNAMWKAFLEGGAVVRALGIATFAVIGFFFVSWMSIHVAVANAFGDLSLRRLGLVNLVAWPTLSLLAVAAHLFVVGAYGDDFVKSLRLQAAISLVQELVRSSLYLPLAWRTIKTIEAATED